VVVNTASPTKGTAAPVTKQQPSSGGQEKASLESFDFDSVLQRDLVENGTSVPSLTHP
jgi:hypothetical protein